MGSFGAVWEAEQTGGGPALALKEILCHSQVKISPPLKNKGNLRQKMLRLFHVTTKGSEHLVSSFLDRHGFSDVDSPRNLGDHFQCVKMEPVYPIEVARELGDVKMENLLIGAGAHCKPKALPFRLMQYGPDLQKDKCEATKEPEVKNLLVASRIRKSCIRRISQQAIRTEWL
eukprot:symbB.v1.2.011914.t2/scaffold794.1/size161992/7